MKMVIFLSFIFLAICTASIINFDDSLDDEWRKFKSLYNKTYADDIEDNMREQIYKSNKMIITNHNEKFSAGNVTYSLAMNQFGDLTNLEFSTLMNGFNPVGKVKECDYDKAKIFSYFEKDEIPAAIDWREKGYVTPVKDQKECASCWAFSTTGSLEGQNYGKHGVLVSLSEQNLIDCTIKFGNFGCRGGFMDYSFEYIKVNHGLDTEESYPYEAKDDDCRYNSSNSGATDKGFVCIPSRNENALLHAVAKIGPVSVGFDGSSDEFKFYNTGLFYNPNCNSSNMNHAMLTVGYGTDQKGNDFWIVKNSWGLTWGDKGYLQMARNKNNNCGIATYAVYPLV